MTQEQRRIYLIQALLDERGENLQIPTDEYSQKRWLRGLMNLREAGPISEEWLQIQDDYLKEENQKTRVELKEAKKVKDQIYLWQGDITHLAADGIVNAANSGMTGCYIPNHACIDNCIHSQAGLELREDCAQIMKKQGYPEPTGKAKITKAYNLPANYVLHTVGPIVQGAVTEKNRQDLKNAYRACLETADSNGLKSLAFCCISTGVFHFPNQEAAEIAIQTVKDYLNETGSSIDVVFNVYKDEDLEIYEKLLS